MQAPPLTRLRRTPWWTRCAAIVMSVSVASGAVAEVEQASLAAQQTAVATQAVNAPSSSITIDKSYALGVANYDLDHATEVTGWRVSERWFFGRQRGMDSGLTLVWQQQANQVSLSKEGVRFTRRF